MTQGRVRQDKRRQGARKENFHQDRMSGFTFYNLGGPSRAEQRLQKKLLELDWLNRVIGLFCWHVELTGLFELVVQVDIWPKV